MPSERLASNKNGFRKQEEWYLNMEGLLHDIIELGKRDEDLAYEAFSENTFHYVLSLFPLSLVEKLEEVQGNRKQKLEAVLVMFGSFRDKARRMGKVYGDKVPPGTTGGVGSVINQPDKSDKQAAQQVVQQSALPGTFFKTAQDYPECRICKQLESDGDNDKLFENHMATYPTGCPRFISMKMVKRKDIAIKAKLCLWCLDPDVTYDTSHRDNCRVQNGKLKRFSCEVGDCKNHMWLCSFHKLKNATQLKKHQEDLKKKGFDMVLTSWCVRADKPVQLLGVSEATDAVTKAVRKAAKDDTVQVNPVPDGRAMFLFFHCKGKNNGVNCFFDNGCTEAVFREGIPGGELIAEKTTKGPFTIGGVGGLECKANDEWIVSFEKTDGHRQLIRGLTVDKVTDNFPLVRLGDAIAEVKANCNTEWVRNCRTPKQAGGVTDVLIGIHYNLIHPEPIHTLESGLCLFKSKLAPHKGGCLAMIGGPHSSFDMLSGAAGSTARMMAQFVSGLEKYRSGDWYPPKIANNPVTCDEQMFAKVMNACEGDRAFREVFEMDEEELEVKGDFEEILELSDGDPMQAGTEKEPSLPVLRCTACKDDYTADIWLPDIVAMESDPRFTAEEKISKIKYNWSIMESGLQIDYRCVKCRDCSQCRNADQSEKISLREENEMQLIKESVHLDWERKKIVCSLPLRGNERDFLSTNKDRAMMVLDQQCRKWSKDSVNKPMILAAFEKLFRTGDTRFLHQLSDEELAKFINKPVQYFIPWRVVYQDSKSTPVRPVLDASTSTRRRADGTGGRCLNDLVAKGRIETMNLLRLALRFSVGLVAMTGDLSQFYYSCELINEQWNLQRFLWRENLDPDGLVMEGVIGALIYGVKCVSPQTEHALEEVAKKIENEFPLLAALIRWCRYVDDFAESKRMIAALREIAKQADEVFARIGLTCKGWTFSGSDPPEAVSKTGVTVGVAGLRWYPRLDMVEIPIPDLHFGPVRRGKIDDSVPRFKGSMLDMDSFTPKKLTRKMAVSKLASVWDLTGKFAPLLAGMKLDVRKTTKQTLGWTDPMPDTMRSRWLDNFWKLESLKGIKFSRARMPSDAVDEKLRMITLVDAADDMMMVGIWVGFLRKDGTWSCQHLIGRCFLTDENGTIPKHELQALTGGANLQCIVKKALGDWVSMSIVAGDSEIALCWATTENKPMAIYHRNRALQIRNSMDLQNLYHVRTESNPSDIGTRPYKVTLKDVGPDSRWEQGDNWMRLPLEEAVSQGVIKPAASLRVKSDQESEYRKGIVFEKIPEQLTKGHVVNEKRVGLIEERAEFSKYLIIPTKYSFPKVVRIMSYVFSFISKIKRNRKLLSRLLFEGKLWFSVFLSSAKILDEDREKAGSTLTLGRGYFGMVVAGSQTLSRDIVEILNHITKELTLVNRNTYLQTQVIRPGQAEDAEAESDRYVNLALLYLYRKGSEEVKHFCKKEKVAKIAVEQDGVLLSKGRLLDEMNFMETGELKNLTLGALGVKTRLPVIERFSPLAYSIAEHVHWNIARHRGVETCTRISAENVSILQAPTLYKELAEDCMMCIMKRKKYLKVEMGPISDHQLTLAPPFWTCQVDLFGPITVTVPGFERETRNRKVLEAKCWVMTAVCPTTRLVNLQTMESSKAAGWIDAFTRLSCEVGCPSFVFCDRDSAGMSAFDIAEIEYRDLRLALHREKGIDITLCPVAGHDRHGHVERIIRSVQESFDDTGMKTKILHATGLQTICKLVESQYNNLPLGYHYGRSADNSKLLKIITPNFLRVGRSNKRSLDGPIKLPANRMEILARVDETYQAWFRIWRDTFVPKLMFQQKWFNSDKELKEGDLVYFRKKESKLDGKWIIGMIQSVERGRDGLIRMVDVKYQNHAESHPQITSRTVRQLVKLWSIEEQHIADDMAELDRKFGKTRTRFQEADDNDVQQHDDHNDGEQADHGLDEDDLTMEGTGQAEDLILEHDDQLDDQTSEDDANFMDAEDQVNRNGKAVSTNEDFENLNNTNEDILLQVETEQVAEEGGAHPQQLGGDGDTLSQQGGDDGPPAASTRSKRKCAKCCCLSHHNFSLHIRSSVPEPLPLPFAMDMTVSPKLVSHYNKMWESENLMLEDSLGNLIMSHGVML